MVEESAGQDAEHEQAPPSHTQTPPSQHRAPSPASAGESARPRAGWAPFLQVGRRVVLRYAIDREASPHGESMSDALGTILAAEEQVVRVMTRRGELAVPRALVIAAKEVPPPPVRRPRSR